VDGDIVFTNPGVANYARDIHLADNLGGLRFFGAPSLTNPANGAAIQFFGNGHTLFPGQAYIDSGSHNNAAVIFRTGTTDNIVTERMRVASNGNVGIGTTMPATRLDVNGNAFVRGSGTIANNGGAAEFHIGYSLANAGTAGSVSRLAIQPYGHTGGPWRFIARDDSSKAYLDWLYGINASGITQDSQGNVGIGTNIPGAKLDVAGNFNISGNGNIGGRLRVEGIPSGTLASFGANGDFQIDAPGGGAPGGRFTVKEDGKVKLGFSYPGGARFNIASGDGAGFVGSPSISLENVQGGFRHWITTQNGGDDSINFGSMYLTQSPVPSQTVKQS
jgi:hypothetical protein